MNFLLALLFAVSGAGATELAAADALVFAAGESGKELLRVTAADLAKRPSARLVEIEDPFYKRRKRYRAVPLKDLMTAAYGGTWGENTLGEVFFEALDGYRSHAPVSKLMNDGGMVAFADADGPWEAIPGRAGSPAPFYLVWTGPEQRAHAGFPWPWQLAEVKMTVLEDEYPKALPKGAGPDSAAGRGWSVFRQSCIACHAMSKAGGMVGPDLNEPRGITRYQSKKHLKAYIRKASSFRHTRMPDFETLTPRELDDLMAYFDHMSALAGTK